ncbi:phage tail tape measure protein [Streptomyces lonarensis]|uniref:Phage tail tape measure protein domain-containing protein n=1 Tax=Streptomyces lonarensis TaxID=700599 RepID=A0A7X6CXJ0_9ACTN|nr:phage tail tape measure protein [Streptomyces lonarensis]NJQ04295.1 hypothetical protein [Streptomyces lonarensis]
MATGPQVGTAWVAIVPSFSGFASSIESELSRAAATAARAAAAEAAKEFQEEFERTSSSSPPEPKWDMGGVGMAAGAVAAGGLALGMQAAMDISGATSQITAQLGLTEAEAARVGDAAGDLFTSGWGESMGDATQAVGAVITSIGDLGDFTDAELSSMTKSAMGLADAFELDVMESTHAVGQLIKTGLVSDAEQGFDLIAATMQQIPAGLRDDVLPTIAEYGTQFRNLGLTGEQAMALMSQGVQAGARDVDVVADTLKEFSIEAVAGSEDMAEAWDELGISSDDMFAKLGEGGSSATEVLGITLDALRGIEDPIERNAMAIEFFGTKAEDMGDALYALDPTTAVLEDMAGASAELNETLEADAGRQFSNVMRDLTTQLGTALLPVMTLVAGVVGDNSELFVGLGLALGVIAAAVTAVSFATKAWTAALVIVKLATAAWTIAQVALNLALWANPIGLIILAIVAIIAIIVVAIVYWDEIAAAISAAWSWIVDATSAAWTWLVAALGQLWAWVSAAAVAAWRAVSDAVSAGWRWITATVSAGWRWLTRTLGQLWSTVTGAAGAAWRWVSSLISSAWTSITGAVSRAASSLSGLLSRTWSSIRSSVSSAWTRVRTAITDAISGAVTRVRGMLWRFVNIGRDIITGMARGVRNAASFVADAARNAARGALNAAKSFLGIGSPSKLFAAEVGQWIPAGVEVGIEGGQRDLTRRIDAMVQVPDVPVVRATVATGQAAAPAPLVIRADGTRASRALVEVLRHSVRTDLGGDLSRLT